MNQKDAAKLVSQTFECEYDDVRFQRFVNELLNGGTLKYGFYDYNTPHQKYRGWIDKFRALGVYTDVNRKRILFVSVQLSRSHSLDRARVMQRNFAADLLRGKASQKLASGADAAVIAFFGEDKRDWRLSLITLESDAYCDKNGKIRVTDILSPAKRYSYLVGVNEPCHTCKERFCPLITDEKGQLTFEMLVDAFHVETVTKEFFTEYKRCYELLTASIQAVIDVDSVISDEFARRNLEVPAFSKKLLGQIVFLYFLQKKGWLGVGRDEEWGSGPKNFMRKLFDKEIVPYENFFDDILEPLFYEALAKKNDYDYYSRFGVRIPFLNGGLFEAEYDWVHTDLVIDNSVFEEIFQTFDRYNFTVKEDEPLEREVAVDPEMLGKVFESLLDTTERKDKGAFYTPRYVVHYICQQSLVEYLLRHLSDEETDAASLRSDIEEFIQRGDEMYAETLYNQTEKVFNANFEEKGGLPESIIARASEVDALLKNIRVADPAVGSGAFPVGMMNEIVKARTALTPCIRCGDVKRSSYALKRETIEHSIYGVDLEPSAVDIAKLRFWLSLIVDEENPKEIQPLPNLDQKIMAGNSLLESFRGIHLFDETILSSDLDSDAERLEYIDAEMLRLQNEQNQIPWGKEWERYQSLSDKILALRVEKVAIEADEPKKEIVQSLSSKKVASFKKSRKGMKKYQLLQARFFNEQDKEKKQQLREEMEGLEWEIIERTVEDAGDSDALEELRTLKGKKGKPFFLWKLYFSEVFSGENPGFDCIIGNPPYVQIQKLDKTVKEEYAKEGYATYVATGDIYCLFYELGYKLLRQSGTLGFITSNKWMRAGYGEKLRGFFAEHTNPFILLDFAGQGVFEEATVDVNILLYQKRKNQGKTLSCIINGDCSGNMSEYIKQNKHKVFCSFDNSESWVILSAIEQRIKKKVESVGIPLKDWDISINYGIKTGYNDAFIISGKKKDELIAQDPKSAEIIRPILRGRDIKRYGYEFADLWLINVHNGVKNKNIVPINIDDYPSIKEHLNQYYSNLAKRDDKGVTPYNLRNCAYLEDFSKQKIVWGNLCLSAQFAYADREFFINAPSTMIVPGNKYLLAVLNSRLGDWYIRQLGVTRNGGYFEYKPMFVGTLPIPQINKTEQIQFVYLIDSILEAKSENKDTSALEREIDTLVYAIYGLSTEEISYIEK